eukprot:TRINITY_DN6237_c0_g1_i1.p1 TRINITY_DN6237_c0_g1~~TRINITY_DN6237_c0_g1_i1.p1  ORF type:complete len:371 (-),score=100.74 TRINITY_DN6237_c0_g1_i1:76-1188(-)
MGIKSSKLEDKQNKPPLKDEEGIEYPPPRQTPHHCRMYGGRGTAVSMDVGKLSTELSHFLLSDKLFHCKTEEEFLASGFYKCVDYPDLESHIYYEGYFHSTSSDQSVPSMNPRYGSTFDKPAAPSAIRAFYVAFRSLNAEALQKISDEIRKLDVDSLMPLSSEVHPNTAQSMSKEELEQFKSRREKQDKEQIEKNKEAVETLSDLFDQSEGAKYRELVLSDLAVQVHYGQGVPFKSIGWHYDGINSLFHLALSVHGNRELYSLAADEPKDKETPVHLNVDKLSIGDVYISSPYLFRHAVSYPEQNWEGRTIAMQARFLMTREVLKSVHGLSQEVKEAVAACVSDVVEKGFKYPTLEDVKRAELSLPNSSS